MKYQKKMPKPPSTLSREAKALWKTLVDDYHIVDSAGLRILQTACEALDHLRAAERQVETDGLMLTGAKDQPVIHPATKVIRDSRSQMLQALKMLNCDVQPANHQIGRPGGSNRV